MNNQAAGNGSFPPPLKGELPSDKDPPRAGAETDRQEYVNQFLSLFSLEPTAATATVGVVLVPDNYRGPPPPVESLMYYNYQMERRHIGYLSYILSAWQRAVLEVSSRKPSRSFPTIQDVMSQNESTAKTYYHYRYTGKRWRSSYHTMVIDLENKLIVHLANDGYLYMPGRLKHPGGKCEEFYAALNDFRVFANAWFGTDDIRQSVVYNADQCCIDIRFQSKSVTPIGLEFSFERGWQYPEDDPSWWD